MNITAIRMLLSLGHITLAEAGAMLAFPDVAQASEEESLRRVFESKTVLQPDGTRRWKELGE